jgi:hypothetical protein
MSSRIFQSILDEKISLFRFAFQQTSNSIYWDDKNNRLIHAGEYGMYREAICKELLRLFIPIRLDIGNGFLINSRGQNGTQCDIVVFDKNATPLIENNDRQRFFPVETVCAIGEIKSDLDKNGLKEAINKLARNKSLREGMFDPVPLKRDRLGKYDPQGFSYDNIFSFIICNKLTFDISSLPEEIDGFYDTTTNPWLKHNLILSIEDGILLYYDHNNVTFHYPTIPSLVLKNRLIIPDKTPNIHFYFFCSALFMGTTSNTIYYPEIGRYINEITDGKIISQK